MAFLLPLLVLAFTVAGRASAGQPAKAPASQSDQPLVRKDLLSLNSPDAPAPLRDIFRPKSSGVPQAFAFRPAMRKPAVAAPEAAPAFALSLTYVGPIASTGKILAMVTVGSQSLPVSVGDEVSPGYKVIRISAESIDIEGPGGQVKTFTR